jgi:pectate lyase-like protein
MQRLGLEGAVMRGLMLRPAAAIGLTLLPLPALAGSAPPPGMSPNAANASLPAALAALYQPVNVKAYGAKGDGVTDDSAAVARAVAGLDPAHGGTVLFPPGSYCVFSGITVTLDDVRLLGSGGYSGKASLIDACGHDVTAVTLNGNRDSISYLHVSGMDSPAVTHPSIVTASVDSAVEHAFVDSGYGSIYNTGAELTLAYDFIGFSYGPYSVFSTGGLHVRKVKADTPYPQDFPPVGATIPAWTANTAVAVDALRTVASGTWLLQATVGGTTGSVEPAAARYTVDIVDGTATWQLAGRANNYAFQLDTVGASGSEFVENDMTGAYYWAVGLTNATGTAGVGNGPQSVRFLGDNFGEGLNGHIYAHDGAALSVTGAKFSNCILSGCAHLRTTGNWAGVTSVTGGIMIAGSYGIDNDVGRNLTVTGQQIHGMSTAALHSAAGQTAFYYIGNDLSTSTIWGSNTVGVLVDTGASNNYVIMGNGVSGAATGVSDNGTGANKTVSGNN